MSSLPREACEAFAANRVEAVLHYSRRSARAFLEAVRAAGVEISALALPQCCLSDADGHRRSAMPGRRGFWSRPRRTRAPYSVALESATC